MVAEIGTAEIGALGLQEAEVGAAEVQAEGAEQGDFRRPERCALVEAIQDDAPQAGLGEINVVKKAVLDRGAGEADAAGVGTDHLHLLDQLEAQVGAGGEAGHIARAHQAGIEGDGLSWGLDGRLYRGFHHLGGIGKHL